MLLLFGIVDLWLHFNLFSIELNVMFGQDMIGAFFLLERNKAKAAWPLLVFIVHHFEFLDLSIAREKLFNLLVSDAVRKAADEHFAVVTSLLVVPLLSGHARITQLDIDDLAVDLVSAGRDRVLGRGRVAVRDKAKAARVARLRVLHHDRVHDSAKLRKLHRQHFFCCVPGESTDKYLATGILIIIRAYVHH